MIFLSIICGIILMLGGIACLFSPAATFFQTGYFLVILLLIYGIIGIIRVIKKEAHPLNLITDILAVIIGIIAIFRPGTTLLFDGLMVYFFAAWFVIQGITSICISIMARKVKRGWFWGVILGAIALILGFYSFFHPMVSIVTIGILVAIYLIQAGLNMIVFAAAVDDTDI